ncbi:hypothetical protein PVAP13_9KG633550 [Panicum virgatum]|uniref:Uncharacterized protein n=1 Tax=Panicum virgatum TaxID=38727 RepID=A0A8T0P3V9_PANVG|nr:hypothetical protein PVAP13_9KG633550 [Panicum virgatum]
MILQNPNLVRKIRPTQAARSHHPPTFPPDSSPRVRTRHTQPPPAAGLHAAPITLIGSPPAARAPSLADEPRPQRLAALGLPRGRPPPAAGHCPASLAPRHPRPAWLRGRPAAPLAALPLA